MPQSLRISCALALAVLAAGATASQLAVAHAQPSAATPPAPSTSATPSSAPAFAPVTQLLQGAPLRGQWELRLSTGADAAQLGNSTTSTTQLYLGLDAFYNRGSGWALGGGFFGAPDDGFFALGGHVDVRYRFWDLVPYVKPTLLAGAGARIGFPRAGNDRSTALFVVGRLGAGLDFAVSKRVLPGIALVLNVGPRVLPSVAAYVSTQALFTLSFLL